MLLPLWRRRRRREKRRGRGRKRGGVYKALHPYTYVYKCPNTPPLEQRTVSPYHQIPVPSLYLEEHHWSRWLHTPQENAQPQRPRSCQGEHPHGAGSACCLRSSEGRRGREVRLCFSVEAGNFVVSHTRDVMN